MISPSELGHSTQELIPNLGDLPVYEQRNRLVDLYRQMGVIDPADNKYITDEPLADIIKLRYLALTGYVGSVKEKMRDGLPLNIIAEKDKITPSDIFQRIKAKDAQDRERLLVRTISRGRLPIVLMTGTDRDTNSNTGYFGGEYETIAMKEHAIIGNNDVTYATILKPDSSDLIVTPSTAIVVYAPEALQEISPATRHVEGSSGFYTFIDPRLKQPSLLATIESVTPDSALALRVNTGSDFQYFKPNFQ